MQVKGLSAEEKALRADLVAALPHRIQAIPDSHDGGATDQDAGWSARPGIKFDDTSGFFFFLFRPVSTCRYMFENIDFAAQGFRENISISCVCIQNNVKVLHLSEWTARFIFYYKGCKHCLNMFRLTMFIISQSKFS